MTGQELFKIFPNCSERVLKSECTNLFNEKISVYYQFCVLKFLYHRINRNYAERGCAFLIAAAVCKFSNCITFKFEMETPQTNANNHYLVTYIATGSISKEHSSNSISHSRHLAGERREATAKQLEFSSPSNLHYSLFAHSQNLSVAEKGNFNYLHRPTSLERSSNSTSTKLDLTAGAAYPVRKVRLSPYHFREGTSLAALFATTIFATTNKYLNLIVPLLSGFAALEQ